jgi:hypothetical protein
MPTQIKADSSSPGLNMLHKLAGKNKSDVDLTQVAYQGIHEGSNLSSDHSVVNKHSPFYKK